MGSRSLSRDTVIGSSNGGAKTSFTAGTTIVFVSLPASKAIMFDDSGNIVDGAGTDTGLATKGFATAMGVAL